MNTATVAHSMTIPPATLVTVFCEGRGTRSGVSEQDNGWHTQDQDILGLFLSSLLLSSISRYSSLEG